ncbi:MAG: hypothetical protein ABSF80_06705 [Chitinispirillaceae bacterium]
MRKTVQTLMTIMALSALSYAGIPVQDMSSTSLGIDYSGMWRGERITSANVPGHESVHLINVRYSPNPYCLFSIGFGGANFRVDTSRQVQFKGTFNFSPSVGANFYTPFFARHVLRLTAGVKANYLYTRDADKSYLYSGPFVTPGAGIVVSLGEFIDLEAGARGDFIFGRMQKGSDSPAGFSNKERARAYFTAMLHTPSEGAYLLVDFDASPKVSMDWANGPAESSIGISVGLILRQEKDKIAQQRKMKEDADYPGFKEMRKKVEEMEEEMK